MDVALLIARLFLALIFGVAGLAKATDPSGTRRALAGFGVPERWAPLLVWVLPAVEILAALALIPLPTAWWGSIAALALLLAFTAAISLSLARGQSPDCRCFGQLHSTPVRWTTLARNLALAAVAGLIVTQGDGHAGLSALNWLNDLRAGEVISLTFSLVVIGWLVALTVYLRRLLKRQAELLDGVQMIKAAVSDDDDLVPARTREAVLPQEGLPIGVRAPRFSLPTIDGDRVSLDELLAEGNPVLLLFAGPDCWGCKILLPAVRLWQREWGDSLTIAVLSSGTLEANQAKMARYEINNLLLDERSTVADEYQAKWTPAAVLIHADGRIASLLSYGDNAIREWLRNLMASGFLPVGAAKGDGATNQIPQVTTRYSVRAIGEAAPRFSLPDLTGHRVHTEDWLGSPTLLLFWHPRCQFCRAMLSDLQDWEENPPVGAPKLVFVAAGEVEEARAVNRNFKSPTLLDPSFEVGPWFGTKFTPSAILLDDEGGIASSLAIGPENVRALIGLRKAAPSLTVLS